MFVIIDKCLRWKISMRNLIAAENEGQEKKDDQRNFICAQKMSIAKG